VTPGRGRADYKGTGGGISRHSAKVDKVDRGGRLADARPNLKEMCFVAALISLSFAAAA
jgi:hypothetical protein